MVYFLQQEASDIPAELITSNEFVHATPKSVCNQSIVITMSLAGGTSETVEAAKIARNKGATVIALCAEIEAPLAKAAS